MYESPIVMVQKTINQQMRKEEDKWICEIEQKVGFHIDKQELIKALNYDRNSYNKGFEDGYNQAKERIEDLERELATFKALC